MTNHRLTRRDFMRLGAVTVTGAVLTACGPTVDLLGPSAGNGGLDMSIGIIVYSQTGHTLTVANKLQERLTAIGHAVILEQIETLGDANPNDPSGTLKTMPSIDGYDALVFGSPVWGGKPAWPASTYLDRIPSLKGRPVAILATGALPAAIGRNQTLAELTEACQSKGAEVIGTGSVCWLSPRRSKQIAEVVESLSAPF